MASFGNFWNGAVVLFKVLVIFVKAWCCIFATFLSRKTLNAIYFPNLRWTLRSYFFAKKLMKNVAEKFCVISEIWTELCQKNFVLKIHCGKPNFARQIKFAWQWKAENQTLWINVVLSFKFRKYKTAFNNGLKIWLLPDFPAENPLLNGMFCYFCNGLVLHLRHIFKPQNVVRQLKKNLW